MLKKWLMRIARFAVVMGCNLVVIGLIRHNFDFLSKLHVWVIIAVGLFVYLLSFWFDERIEK